MAFTQGPEVLKSSSTPDPQGCGALYMAANRNRRNLAIILALFTLQGMLIVFLYSPRATLGCVGPNCLGAGDISASEGTGDLPASAPKPNGTPPNWTLAQPTSWRDVLTTLYDYIEKPHAKCKKSVRVGGMISAKKFDGYKWMCLDPFLGLLQTDRCLIYSFGVDHDWSFDDNAQLMECEIHAFDPSIGRKDHKRSARIFFHNVGVGGKTEVKAVKSGLVSRLWDIRTYQDIVKFLGHEERVVHYMKVDVEGSEWAMLENLLDRSPHLLRNVRQIGMEIHMGWGKVAGNGSDLDTWKRYLNIFMRLERFGFRLFHSEFNPFEPPKQIFPQIARRVSKVYEVVWIYQPW